MSATGWHRIEPGRWRKEVSATGYYEATRTPFGSWALNYTGGWSGLVGYFPTLRSAKSHVDRGEVK